MNRPLTIVLLVLGLAPVSNEGRLVLAAPEAPQIGNLINARTFKLDPCDLANAEQLRPLVEGSMKPFTAPRSGDYTVSFSDFNITEAKCPRLTITVRSDIRIKDTRGVLQGSASGRIRFRSDVEGRIRHRPLRSGSNVTIDSLVKAEACLTDTVILGVNLENVPNVVDQAYVRPALQKGMKEKCTDITDLTRTALKLGLEIRVP